MSSHLHSAVFTCWRAIIRTGERTIGWELWATVIAFHVNWFESAYHNGGGGVKRPSSHPSPARPRKTIFVYVACWFCVNVCIKYCSYSIRRTASWQEMMMQSPLILFVVVTLPSKLLELLVVIYQLLRTNQQNHRPLPASSPFSTLLTSSPHVIIRVS